jgi:hypothetical protein
MMVSIIKYDLEGNYLETITDENINRICLKLKVDSSTMRRALRGHLLTCGNFQYRELDPNIKPQDKIGSVYDLNGAFSNKIIGKYYNSRLICTYSSLKEAAEKNKLDKGNIQKCISGNIYQTGGFVFKYLN